MCSRAIFAVQVPVPGKGAAPTASAATVVAAAVAKTTAAPGAATTVLAAQPKESTKKEKVPAKESKPTATVDVSRLNMRVGLITKAVPHPDADSLYLETVDLGSETRTVISGLAGKVCGFDCLALIHCKRHNCV